ncbi:bifunctional transcriptional activator/DNA repair enzyme AdaA [Aliikangiella coralliicola]|uniref:Methylated-DNA--protein-cysteine methyltransferase n=1 Tax=Aliikangiella coralliicola TaxID=2592383 RepID=A0A545U622_9GAMM|nr:methylated-DNA--[protein]-cysteine S-methyltransferase [Aliikangiella coralliicola]TQV84917.1 methylated-DNA--[protein]-cysteine S-methyltransferase [Aliikangiella coralliicola]
MSQISLPDTREMYQALLNKDASFEGVFIAGVKTTGICCRPTCSARKPKEENVEFFSDVKQALSFGYRPCKVCNPLQPYGDTPDWLKGLLQDMVKSANEKFKDQDLRERGLDPVRVRRWFKKNHGMTFQAYARALRINRAFGLIKHEDKIIDTALDSGYDSVSGFNEAFKKLTGQSPSGSKRAEVITVTRVLTPLGPMFAGATERGICLLEFTDRRMFETQIARLSKLLNARFVPGEHPLFKMLNHELKKYFAGTLKKFNVPLDVPGTDFQQQAWTALQTIPYGETRSYQQQARVINRPEAVRAIAKANGDNRISIIIPCHRVIGKNGKLTGYGGGLWRKQRLLELETGKVNWAE